MHPCTASTIYARDLCGDNVTSNAHSHKPPQLHHHSSYARVCFRDNTQTLLYHTTHDSTEFKSGIVISFHEKRHEHTSHRLFLVRRLAMWCNTRMLSRTHGYPRHPTTHIRIPRVPRFDSKQPLHTRVKHTNALLRTCIIATVADCEPRTSSYPCHNNIHARLLLMSIDVVHRGVERSHSLHWQGLVTVHAAVRLPQWHDS
jgi:hypothetical protein